MDSRELKRVFGEVAKAHGFNVAPGGWYRQVPIGLLVLNLQRSNFGNYYEVNIKVFLGHAQPVESELKRLVNLAGDIFRRQPEEYRSAFDLDVPAAAVDRESAIDRMFSTVIDRIVSAADESAGILRLRDAGILYLLPGIEERLTKGIN